jgi:hypothetical protein
MNKGRTCRRASRYIAESNRFRYIERMNLRWPKRFAALLHLHASHAQLAEVPSSGCQAPARVPVRWLPRQAQESTSSPRWTRTRAQRASR